MKLLIIADDFTGALDTGVQFASQGVTTRVSTDYEYNFEYMPEDTTVLVIDIESRHEEYQEAYRRVFGIVQKAVNWGVPYIYKKTDSALRGNIGAELQAVSDAMYNETIHFIPAYPKTKRTTEKGIHYIDGVKVSDSVLGKDPFNPVRHSYIPDLIAEQSNIDVQLSSVGFSKSDQDKGKGHVIVYDARNDGDIKRIAGQIFGNSQKRAMAGCAGFASALSDILSVSCEINDKSMTDQSFLMACGSINPITRDQIQYATDHNFTRIHLECEEKLNLEYYKTVQGKKRLREWISICKKEPQCIIDMNDFPGELNTLEYARNHGYTEEEIRERISQVFGYVLKQIVDAGVKSTMFIIGGDSLNSFMQQIQCTEVIPMYEIYPGVVLSEYERCGRKHSLITKSGGFGEKELLLKIAEQIQ